MHQPNYRQPAQRFFINEQRADTRARTKERIYIEMMEDVLGNAQKIIMDENSSNGIVPYLPLGELNTKKK